MLGITIFSNTKLEDLLPAEWWVVNVQDKKEQISKDKKSNRIIFLAGSNGLFGLNSNIISNITEKNAINLAMHASLDISYYRMLLEKNITDGDIVILLWNMNIISEKMPIQSGLLIICLHGVVSTYHGYL
ncbi:Uncharacterised protein [Salmonella enterica subsp. arizonae]|uniref:Uncharacterized protein n=1 Tax=Salmonella enterica subsp. arizonae TaxID=59203 RepID=A0A379SYV3_SALER|nr:Uncharacterised protein [Salmonella enterica subsp. arizonae]